MKSAEIIEQECYGISPQERVAKLKAWRLDAMKEGMRRAVCINQENRKADNYDCCKAILAMLLLSAQLDASTNHIFVASWERFSDSGKIAANGKPFDPSAMMCATWCFDLGKTIRVTDIHNGLSVKVKVTDRPARKYPNRIDLSPRAFSVLNGVELGVCDVYAAEEK